ncbi:MAG: putative quinol monooxygenase [Verrucomicrobiales bacterium]|nr:putative quinol monooxygenase [Verrucomicrobiota bacterium]
MLWVHVMIHVNEADVDAFRQASLENARQSREEPGIAQFDLVQQRDDPTRFVLIEVYRDAEAPLRHKETAHYLKWRDTVAPMMASPRTSISYQLC